jgi:potassium-transporting ATPase KdpC subunit
MITTYPSALRPALMFALLSLFVFGLSYSLLTTALAQALFKRQAEGSLLTRAQRVVGSAWVAQAFSAEHYFIGRPSASNYDLMALAGSNQARSNPDLQARIAEARAAVATREGVSETEVPGELYTQSGGGIDPHISVAGARIQLARVARARGARVPDLEELLAAHTEAPQWGFMGQARVNVLPLNMALDERFPMKAATQSSAQP